MGEIPYSASRVRPATDHSVERQGPSRDFFFSAEGVGFEPTVDPRAHNGFRDRPVQPLRHPSIKRVAPIGAPSKQARLASARGSGLFEVLSEEAEDAPPGVLRYLGVVAELGDSEQAVHEI